MDLININKEIYEASKRLAKGPAELFALARKNAEAERIYRRALSMEIMRLRLDKLPATIIMDVARGNISDLLFARDLSEAEWTAGRDGLRSLQSQVSALQSIIRVQNEV